MSLSKEQKIWNAFCEQLKEAGNVIMREDLPTTEFDRAEGLRYMARLTKAGLDTFCELTGPKYPVLRPQADMVKMGLDNPDNYYVGASINAKYDYRITGNRGTIHFLGFAAQAQNFAARNKLTGGAGHLNHGDMIFDEGGNFELIASQREHPGNWLQLGPETSQILVRQTFLDKLSERPATLKIECLQADGPPPPLDPERFGNALMGAASYGIGCGQWFADWVADFANHAPENTMYLPDAENHRAVGGDPEVRIYLGRWRLASDEALRITLQPPNCDYWNFQLANVWAESFDYRFQQVHINSGNAHYSDDGSVELLVAAQHPASEAHPNWITTAHHEHGIMGVRWVRADAHPQPQCEVVKLDSL